MAHDLEALRIDRSSASPRRAGRAWALGLGALGALTLAVAAWWASGGADRAAVRTALVAPPGSTAAGTVLDASGYVTARRRATVSSKVTGRLVETRVEEGLPVRRDDVLARLDDAQLRAALALAESRLDAARGAVEETRARIALAELTAGRAARLSREGVVGQAELDEARTNLAALRARETLEQRQADVAVREVTLARTELDEAVIRAPFDGIVISRDAQVGEMVSPVSAGGGFTRTGICTLVDMTSLEIEVDVNEAYISRVRPGQAVDAVLDAYPDWRIPARVITTVPAADRQKATVLVRIGFEQLDPRILPDMGVKVALREIAGPDETARPGVRLPRAALRRDGERDVVFVVQDGRVERRAITPGRTQGEEVEVLAGVRPGERIVVEGPPGLRDGQPIEELESGGHR